MTPMIVLRYGELFLKGNNRPAFEKILLHNVKHALAVVGAVRIERGQGRTFVEFETEIDAVTLARAECRLSKVFGLSSYSPALAVEANLDAFNRAATTLLDRRGVRNGQPSFKVETRRSDKRFPLNSVEISRELGGRIVDAFGLRVDLHQPQIRVGVEVGPKRSFVFLQRHAGAGGLPVSCSGRAMLLLSGGIDSPVAGNLMQKRGCALRAIYFHSPPYTSEHAKEKVIRLCQVLAEYQADLPLYVVPFTEVQKAIRDGAPAGMAVVLYRRMMMRIASAFASAERCGVLVTGESLGQVASQTLENLRCIEAAASLPVLRPLIGFDKAETIVRAQAIETYPISILPHQDCCSLFVPKHPATHLPLHRAEEAEAKLPVDQLVEAACQLAERVDVLPSTSSSTGRG
jgi:thiamine biosynthesis protein ThiI